MPTRRFGDGSRTSRDLADLEALLGPDVLSRVRAALELGSLVGVSLSRDGGACSLALTYDGVTEREWFRDAAAAVMWLDDMLGLLEEARAEKPPPATRRGAVRGTQNGR